MRATIGDRSANVDRDLRAVPAGRLRARPTSRAPSTRSEPTLIFFYDSLGHEQRPTARPSTRFEPTTAALVDSGHLRHRQVRRRRRPTGSRDRRPGARQRPERDAGGPARQGARESRRRPSSSSPTTRATSSGSSAGCSTRPSSSARCSAPPARGAKHAVAVRRERRPAARGGRAARRPDASAHARRVRRPGRRGRPGHVAAGARSTPTRCRR